MQWGVQRQLRSVSRLLIAIVWNETEATGRLRRPRLAGVVTPFCVDAAVVTETFCAQLHGVTERERSGRIRSSARGEPITLVVRAIVLTQARR